MDPHLLRTFVTVAGVGSFSAAARELGYTQSAVSQHIAALEHDLGATLLLRRPVAPTEAGTRLLEHAGPLLLRLDAARADIARLLSATTGRLAVGVTPLAMSSRLSGALADVRREQPGLAVSLRVVGQSAVVRGVATGELDLALVAGPAAPSDPLHLPEAGPLTTIGVAEEPPAVALPIGHPLAGRDGVRLADLGDARWIDAPEITVGQDRLRTVCGYDGFPVSLRYEGTDVRSLVTLVAAGHGLALLPASVLEEACDVVGVAVTVPRMVHRIEAVHGGTRAGSEAVALLADRLTDPARGDAAAVRA
ncbi:LysR family transcriptional regulator [Streptomyces sp. NPDC018833]|uniref:LysR family transcriptional regulator n=1 Tax=Streptomyces sp. NPDC018833 TaxID=3365053 RepID=UPI0037BB13DB